MCGRYTLTADKSSIASAFNLHEVQIPNLKPNYNIAPSQPVPVIVERPEPQLDFFQWGLIPSWSKDPAIGNSLINARSETLLEKPSFKGPFRNQRCLILADGFYEWKNEGKWKTPHYIRLKSKAPFAFAGIWSHWMGKDGSEISSCAIITTEPNELVKSIHNRMPVILPRQARDIWLNPSMTDVNKLASLLTPLAADLMEAYSVSRLVNSPDNNDPKCIEPSFSDSGIV